MPAVLEAIRARWLFGARFRDPDPEDATGPEDALGARTVGGGGGFRFLIGRLRSYVAIAPDIQRMESRDRLEVRIRREHCELVANAELGDEGVDRADLNPASAAGVPQLGRANVILAVRNQQGKGGEPLDDAVPSARAAETLKELLKHEARGEDRVTGIERPRKERNLGAVFGSVAPQRQRPHARVDEDVQPRVRSDL